MNDTTEQLETPACPICGVRYSKAISLPGYIALCRCHLPAPTATPTPALRWKAQEKHWAADLEKTDDYSPVLQQLWEIRENGAIRQEWRCVEEVGSDASDGVA